MKTAAQRVFAVAGFALILLVNALMLGAAAYNRSGEPESELTLSQRELNHGMNWGYREAPRLDELSLRWRYPGRHDAAIGFDAEGAQEEDAVRTPWLDAAALAALGFVLPQDRSSADPGRFLQRQPARAALVVLELDGPACRAELARAHALAEKARARAAALPDDKNRQTRAEQAQEQLKRFENEETRLYAVDAGVDLAVLRAKYPDRQRYAIVPALIELSLMRYEGKLQPNAWATPLNAKFAVPRARQPDWMSAWRAAGSGGPAARTLAFTARVAFGRRLEPWVVGVQEDGVRKP